MSLTLAPKGAKSAILQAQESSEVVGDQGHKGGYRRFSTLGHGNVQLRDAPLPVFTALAPQSQRHSALRLEHKLQSVDKHRLRKKKICQAR